MKNIFYEEEGVASAVGTIFAILIFVSLLSLFVSTYVPATMAADEEQYSSAMMNSMVNLASTISQLSLNYRQGETALVPFDLESSYVPIFSSPTMGFLNISSNTAGQEGYLKLTISGVSGSTSITAGGAIMAFTNNRYFTDEAWTFEFSSLYYFSPIKNNQQNSSLISNLIQISPSTQNSYNVSIFLVNIIGGPSTISTSSPVAISVGILSKQNIIDYGNYLNFTFSSNFLNNSIYVKNAFEQSGISQTISFPKNTNPNTNLISVKLNTNTEIYITEVTIIIGMSNISS